MIPAITSAINSPNDENEVGIPRGNPSAGFGTIWTNKATPIQ